MKSLSPNLSKRVSQLRLNDKIWKHHYNQDRVLPISNSGMKNTLASSVRTIGAASKNFTLIELKNVEVDQKLSEGIFTQVFLKQAALRVDSGSRLLANE